MNPELSKYFEDYDLDIHDEEEFDKSSRIISANFEEKMAKFGKGMRFAQDLIALYHYFRDTNVTWQRKSIVVAALLYFILPIDAIPDFAPFVGYLDDFGVIAAVAKYMSDELKPYYPVVQTEE